MISEKLLTHINKRTVSDEYLICTNFTYEELYLIAEYKAPKAPKKSRYLGKLKLESLSPSYLDYLETKPKNYTQKP